MHVFRSSNFSFSLQFLTLRVGVRCIELRFSFEFGCSKRQVQVDVLFLPLRRVEGLSFAVYVYAARSLHDPDNKLPRSGCIKPGRKGETGEVGRYAALNGKSVNVVNRNKRGATRSFRLRKHKTTRGVFVNEVTLS